MAVVSSREALSHSDLDARFREYFPKVTAFMRQRISDPSAAEDLAAEVFLQVLCHHRGLRQAEAFPGWLFTIARRVVANYWRHHHPSSEIPPQTEELGEPASNVEGLVLAREKLGAVHQELCRLPKRQQWTVALRAGNGLSYRQVGQLVGVSEAHARILMYRAVARLRSRLHDY